MAGDRLGQWRHFGPPAQHPPTEAGECAADHRAHGATHRAAPGDAAQQGAEGVVVGQVLDGAQQQCRGEACDSGQKSDDDDAASELEGATTHALNLCRITPAGLLHRTAQLPGHWSALLSVGAGAPTERRTVGTI